MRNSIQQNTFKQIYILNSRGKKIDATRLPFDDEYFEAIIASHILEHIPDYQKALAEIFRVCLMPGGIAILQTPFSRLLKYNFEDENVQSEDQREFFYGQCDHVRVFGEHQFISDLKNSGFELQIRKHKQLFEQDLASLYSVNQHEDLIQVIKPDNAQNLIKV